MLRIAVHDDPMIALAFIDYMAMRGIELVLAVEPGDHFVIFLADQRYQADTESEWQQFLSHPGDPKYRAAFEQAAQRKTFKVWYNSPSLLSMLKQGAGPVSLSVMIVAIAIYIGWIFGWQRFLFDWLHFPLMQGDTWELWRYVSHSLLHFSLLHLVFNCLWWWILGGQLERHSGSGKLLEIFLLSALVSGLAQFWVGGPNFGGLSGVVYALMGYLWWLGWLAPSRGLNIPNGIVVFMLVWLILGFADILGIKIANMAHLFGLVTGCFLAFVDARLRHPEKKAH
ncbi:rhomboid family intramembrane serine protease GlpG [Photobacterium galatheae]|uniref:Intramembrane serine protease GlpG n=1 Tax=Photobacterium galatheae TaxID=1654360 RepID=A0A066RPF6_9GAMM|nr:rhomboid family intramembrane serine protease GlpG [Photobacterium galatheae]KDM92350.1 intramembrane serine protease GlpG [Photobacterium galatheae]MCM0150861.1 rhomboid family intramembrane serine protease GlpG [Photobacterium galatheae]